MGEITFSNNCSYVTSICVLASVVIHREGESKLTCIVVIYPHCFVLRYQLSDCYFFAVDVVQNLVCELKMHSTYFHQDFQNTVSPLLLTSLMMKNAYTVSVDSVCHSSAALLHTDFSGST